MLKSSPCHDFIFDWHGLLSIYKATAENSFMWKGTKHFNIPQDALAIRRETDAIQLNNMSNKTHTLHYCVLFPYRWISIAQVLCDSFIDVLQGWWPSANQVTLEDMGETDCYQTTTKQNAVWTLWLSLGVYCTPGLRSLCPKQLMIDIDGLVQDCGYSSALAMELLQFCAKQTICAALYLP